MKELRKQRENRPVFLFLPTNRRRTAQNKSPQSCRQEALPIPFFPSPGEIPHCPNSITGEFRPQNRRHKDQQVRRFLWKLPGSPSNFGTPKDERDTTFLRRPAPVPVLLSWMGKRPSRTAGLSLAGKSISEGVDMLINTSLSLRLIPLVSEHLH